MSDIICRVCGEPWDDYHLRHDAPAWVRPLVLAGAGCESCDGIAPEGADTDAIALESDRSLVFDGPEEGADPNRLCGEVPAWKRPDDTIVWECADCGVRIMRDVDEREGHDHAYYVSHDSPAHRRDLYLDSAGDLETLRDELSHDGAHCKLCLYPCDGCKAAISDESSFPDPRNPYVSRNRYCEECYSREEYDSAVESFDARDLARALQLNSSSRDWFRAHVRFKHVPSDLYEIDHEGIHYRVPRTCEGIAAVVRKIRKAARS